jgi:hypothetical protein
MDDQQAANTVKRALAADGPPRYQRAARASVVDAVEPRIPELRPVYLPPDPASRTAYAAGEVAQCNLWFPDIEVPVGFGQARTATRLPVLVMVTGYARWLAGQAHTLAGG